MALTINTQRHRNIQETSKRHIPSMWQCILLYKIVVRYIIQHRCREGGWNNYHWAVTDRLLIRWSAQP